MLTGAKFKNQNGAKRPADRRPQREGGFPRSWGQCLELLQRAALFFSAFHCVTVTYQMCPTE